MNLAMKNVSSNQVKRHLTLNFSFLLSLFLILLMAAYAATSMSSRAKAYDHQLLNIASQQRMLVHQYSSEVNYVLLGLASHDLEMALSHKKKLDITAVLFETAHKAILDGGEVHVNVGFDLGAESYSDNGGQFQSSDDMDQLVDRVWVLDPMEDEKIRTHMGHVESEWLALKRLALLSMRSNSESVVDSPYVHQLLNQAVHVVAEMNRALSLIRDRSERDLSELGDLLLLILIVGVVLFLFVVYFVYTRIILPLDNTVRTLESTTETLRLEKLKADAANHAKSDFLSRMSHELRTPMNAILGFAQLLRLDSKNFSDTDKGNVEEIYMAGQHLLTLINEVLDLARIESGKLEVSLEAVSVDEVLQQCITLVNAQAEARQINIVDQVSGQGYHLIADFTRYKQVLLNLLTNAVKYNNEQGSITIDCECVEANRLRIRITDTGDGLNEVEVEKLFTSFERLNAVDNVEGTGIGLVITKHLVELMQGSIGIESHVGVGTTFWVDMPLSIKD